ncbi:F-box protein At5g03100-like [Durio zibethinus]|uniref:F-box protein At5g03100-like n=1 Tax=Durio zibethinus TaxID=66656 RepID=A0A6P5Y5Y5_DURZI|nr:F-box protein At5g03100-like [Durio zibethinus]
MQEDNEDNYSGTWEYVNKRLIWMQRKKKKQFSLSHLHLQQATPSTPPRLDRISELPDHLLYHILSLMPMQMAIQTIVLSTRWRHLWKHTHVVHFHTLPLSFWESVDYAPISRSLNLIESPTIESYTVSVATPSVIRSFNTNSQVTNFNNEDRSVDVERRSDRFVSRCRGTSPRFFSGSSFLSPLSLSFTLGT